MCLVLIEISWLCLPPALSSPDPLSDCLRFAPLDSTPAAFPLCGALSWMGAWLARLRVDPLHSPTNCVYRAFPIFTTVLRLDPMFSGESFQAALGPISISCPSASSQTNNDPPKFYGCYWPLSDILRVVEISYLVILWTLFV